MSHPPLAPVPRPAATLLVVRPAPAGIEVLMLKRAEKGDHNSGAWVFPGGLLDPSDRASHACCTAPDDATASWRLGVPEGGLDYYVAAVRETFEEAGLLLAVDEHGNFPALGGEADMRIDAARGPIGRGERDFGVFCREHGLRLATDRLHYIAHWVTPAGMPKRFDTRFFLALLPPGQRADHDAVETLDHGWFRPADLLRAGDSRKLLLVTRCMLQLLARFDNVDALMRWAESPREVRKVERRRSRDANGPQVLMPDHPAWPEVGLLDPHGEGSAWCELPHGALVRLSPRVQRITHASGNSYLVGDAAHGWVVIDPSDAAGDVLSHATGGEQPRALSTGKAAATQPLAPGAGLLLQPMDTPAGTAWLLVHERILFSGDWTPTAANVPPEYRAVADWAAPSRGFLVPLR